MTFHFLEIRISSFWNCRSSLSGVAEGLLATRHGSHGLDSREARTVLVKRHLDMIQLAVKSAQISQGQIFRVKAEIGLLKWMIGFGLTFKLAILVKLFIH